MPLEAALQHLPWGSLYVASEWVLRIGAFLYVPQRRPPNAARAWLLLIFFLPWPGLLLYLLIGRAYLPRRRFQLQKQVFDLIRRLAPRTAAQQAALAQSVAPPFAPAFRLAEALSEFPPEGGNHFALLPAYDAAIQRLLDDISGAQHFVHLLFYIYENDEVGQRVSEALIGAARRGVAVRVLMDAVGSRAGLRHQGPRLRGAGIEVVAVMPLRLWGPNAARLDLRNHRKIAVIDGTVAFFGSQNIVSAHANRGLVNEELLVRATGPVVRQLHAVLLGDRYFETGGLPPEAADLTAPPPTPLDHGLAQVLASGPGYSEGTAEAVMIALMYGARSRIVLTSPYVIPSEAFLAAMLAAARRGVQVLLIVDAESNKPLVQLAQQSFYDAMLAAGVAIHRHKRSFLHAKHLSVDDTAALVGSSNLDIRSFALNAEISVLIWDRAFVLELAALQQAYLRNSDRVSVADRQALPRHRRVLENLARLTDSLL